MFRIEPAPVTLDPRFGSDVSGLLSVGPDGVAVGRRREPRELSTGWLTPTARTPLVDLIDWPCRMVPFQARERELAELAAWAEEDAPVSVRFLVGDPATGKSRLCAELCDALRARGWSAGFVDPTVSRCFLLRGGGVFLVVDDARSIRAEVGEMFSDLAVFPPAGRLRVLVVAGEEAETWEDAVRRALLEPRVAPRPFFLPKFTREQLREIVQASFVEAARLFALPPVFLSEEKLTAFLDTGHAPPAALLAAFGLLAESSPEAFGRPVREALQAAAPASDRTDIWLDEMAAERAFLATGIAGALSYRAVRALARDGLLGPRFTEESLARSTWISAGESEDEPAVQASDPNLGIVGFTLAAAARHADAAPELLWAGASAVPGHGMAAIGGIAFGCETSLGLTTNPIGRLFTAAVSGRPERCRQIDRWFCQFGVPQSQWPLAVLTGREAIAHESNPSALAGMWSRLGDALEETGDEEGARQAVNRSVDLLRSLAKADPAWRDPQLAATLMTLAEDLEEKDRAGGYRALREALEVLGRLAEADPVAWGERYATGLDMLADWLREDGDVAGAAEMLEVALPIRRELAEHAPPGSLSWTWLQMTLEQLWELLHDDRFHVGNELREPRDAANERAFRHLEELIALERRWPLDEEGREHYTLGFHLVWIAEEYRVRDRRDEAIAALGEGIEMVAARADEQLERVLKSWRGLLADWESGADLELERQILKHLEMEKEIFREAERRKRDRKAGVDRPDRRGTVGDQRGEGEAGGGGTAGER